MKKTIFFPKENEHAVYATFARSVGAVDANSVALSSGIREFDVALVHSITSLNQAVAAKERHPELRIIYLDTDCFFAKDYFEENFLQQTLHDCSLKKISGIISVSYLNASYAQNVPCLKDIPVKVVRPFITTKKQELARLESKNVLVMNNFGEYDNSVQQVRSVKNTPYTCLAVGQGEQLNNAIKTAPPKTRFFTQYRPEVLFKKASIFLNVADYEPFGITACEAVQAGLLPLLGPENGNSEVLGSELIVQEKNWQSIREKVLEVMSWPTSKKSSLQYALRLRIRQLGENTQVRKFQEAFRSLTN